MRGKCTKLYPPRTFQYTAIRRLSTENRHKNLPRLFDCCKRPVPHRMHSLFGRTDLFLARTLPRQKPISEHQALESLLLVRIGKRKLLQSSVSRTRPLSRRLLEVVLGCCWRRRKGSLGSYFEMQRARSVSSVEPGISSLVARSR